MAEKSLKKQLEELAEKMSHEETRDEARKELTLMRDKAIKEMDSPKVHDWDFEDQQTRACDLRRTAIRIERVLNGEESAQKLGKELCSKVPQRTASSAEEKDVKYLNYDLTEPSGYRRAIANWYSRKARVAFDPKTGRVRGE